MIGMREREIDDAVVLISAFMRNRDNWLIDRDKVFIIKLKNNRALFAGKIVYISSLGGSTLLSLAVLKRKFSFRCFRFVPVVKIMNVPLENVEYLQNAMPEVAETPVEGEQVEEKDVSYM